MVKVATQGAAVKEIDYQEGMNVKDVLREAEMAANASATITVNGKDADRKTAVPDESVVVVTAKIRNG